MSIIDLIPSDVTFDSTNNTYKSKDYIYTLSTSSEKNDNLAANVFANDNTFWETAASFSQIEGTIGEFYPTYDISSNPIHNNGEWLDISIQTIRKKPREYFLTQVTLTFINGDGDMRTGHIMGKNNGGEYKMLKMMGDYSVIIDSAKMISDGATSINSDPSVIIGKITNDYKKPYIYRFSTTTLNVYISHVTPLQRETNDFAHNMYIVSGVYGTDYIFYNTYEDAKQNTNKLSEIKGRGLYNTILGGDWERHLMVLYEHMADKIQYGDDVVHTYNLNPSDPHDTYRFIFSQLQSGESLKVKRIQMKGTRQNYNINAFDSHLEHFTNYESSHEKRSDSFDTITKTLFDYDNGEHKYSMFLIPSVLLFLSTILIIKNKI